MMNQLDDRIKTMQYVLKYSDFSIFCAEVTDMFGFMMPLLENVEFEHDVWYYSATIHLKGKEQLKFVICDEGFAKHQLLYRKNLSGWKQLFDATEYQGTNCLNGLHEVLIYYRIHLETWYSNRE